MNAPISSLHDVQALEQVPLQDRDLPPNTYELLRRSAQQFGPSTALSFLLQGSAAEEPIQVSYAELFSRVTQAANAFHRLGVRPGRRSAAPPRAAGEWAAARPQPSPDNTQSETW